MWEKITRGASYVEAVADIPKRIISITERSKWILFTETVLTFDDGSTVTVPSARGAVVQYLREQGKIVERGTHEELFGQQGAYYNLIMEQQRVAEDDQSMGGE